MRPAGAHPAAQAGLPLVHRCAGSPRRCARGSRRSPPSCSTPLPADTAVRPHGAYAFPLPVQVICELLGVPAADRDRFGAWSRVDDRPVAQPTRRTPPPAARLPRRADRARSAPSPTTRCSAPSPGRGDDGDRLSEPELVAMAMLLLIAGHETTSNLVGNGVLALLTHPDQLALLRARPGADAARGRGVPPLRLARCTARPSRFAAQDVEMRGRRRSRRARPCSSRWARPTATPPGSPTPTSCGSTASCGPRRRSATASTSASAPRSPASRARWRSARCCAVPGWSSPDPAELAYRRSTLSAASRPCRGAPASLVAGSSPVGVPPRGARLLHGRRRTTAEWSRTTEGLGRTWPLTRISRSSSTRAGNRARLTTSRRPRPLRAPAPTW